MFIVYYVVCFFFFFFFNDTATTEIYTLSLHDALPICEHAVADPLHEPVAVAVERARRAIHDHHAVRLERRSEEHTSELQSQSNLVCRLLLEKKKKKVKTTSTHVKSTIAVGTTLHSLKK